ncbi:MAG: glycosyltransferase family 4 protein [Kiritimatiellae bacterium]|nr:glycosyltransferase family 4 protein [Kiritimatiellia bacterium]
MKVILSTGHGRLHLVQSATWLRKLGLNVRVLTGWIPKHPDGLLVKLASKIVRRDLTSGMKKRLVPELEGCVRTCPLAESLDTLLRVACRILKISTHRVSSIGWTIFGLASRKYLKDADIFHCRSGAGQGGAIKLARNRGMKILVDHSCLHPAKCEENLKDDYARWGQEIVIAPGRGVWKNVLKDCEDADMIMVNANHIRDSFVEQGYAPEKVRVVYLGVREDFQGVKKNYASHGTFRVLFTGGFIILKGAEYLLESLKILKERGVDVAYDVIGSVGAPKALLEKYSNLPFKFYGVLPQDNLKSHLANADAYLFPSLADGCAQSGMEALTAGLPVVATYQSGLPITDGENGCVVPMKDAMAIADKIEWLIAHPEERERLGKSAAKMMREKYTWRHYAENVRDLYEELVESGS